MKTITMTEARRLYRKGNDAGLGYAPYTDEERTPEDDSIDFAIECAKRDGWELILSRDTSEDVAVLGNEDDELMAIGGDAMGVGAWAVIISEVSS